MNCIYCKKVIIESKRPDKTNDYSKVYMSSEHIIQNALGGKLESENICCDRCNNHIQKLIDDEFCKIFVPFTSEVEDFKKTNNAGSKPKSKGYAILNDGNQSKLLYADVIKKTEVKQSKELINMEKIKGTENLDSRIKSGLENLNVMFQTFDLDNKYFKLGLSKIAFNYAVSLGIDVKILQDVCNVKLDGLNNELTDIDFNTKLIPFVAGNDFDEFIELNSSFQLFHNLILYRYMNQLWCYIDLFNTFQFYVLLTENYSNNEGTRYWIYGNEFQYVQSNRNSNHTYSDIISEKLEEYHLIEGKNMNSLGYDFYFDKNTLTKFFRIETPLENHGNGVYRFIHYPLWVVQAKNREEKSKYMTQKYVRLNQFLIESKPIFPIEKTLNMNQEDQNKFWELYFNAKKPSGS